MKKQGNAEIAARIDSLKQSLYNNSLSIEETEAVYAELDGLYKEYDLFDVTFEEDGCKGVKDIAGKVRVPAMYKEYPEVYSYAWGREMPMAAVNKEGKCALVAADGTGTALCGFEYDNISYMRGTNDMFLCRRNEGEVSKEGVLNAKGEVIVPCKMDTIYEFANNFAAVKKGEKYGIVTYSGAFIEPVYDDVEEKDGYIMACKEGVWGYISEGGKFIAEDDEEAMRDENLLALFEC